MGGWKLASGDCRLRTHVTGPTFRLPPGVTFPPLFPKSHAVSDYRSDPERTLASQVVTPPGAQPTVPGAAKAVLLVDDNEGVRVLSARVLEEAGYMVLEAATGRRALELLHAHAGPVDLLITDVRMPQMSGGELAAEIKRVQPAIPVLFISGYTDEPFARRSPVPSSIRVLPKPFTPETLLVRVAELIGQSARGPG